MADVQLSILKVLVHEGGFQDDPRDSGNWTDGIVRTAEELAADPALSLKLKGTNFGISAASFPNLDIRNLAKDQATEIYRKDYVNPLYAQIESQPVCDILIDFGVTSAPKHSVEYLQRAIRLIEVGPIVADGIFGDGTLGAVNAADGDRLAKQFTRLRILFYHSLPAEHLYFETWLDRSFDW